MELGSHDGGEDGEHNHVSSVETCDTGSSFSHLINYYLSYMYYEVRKHIQKHETMTVLDLRCINTDDDQESWLKQ